MQGEGEEGKLRIHYGSRAGVPEGGKAGMEEGRMCD